MRKNIIPFQRRNFFPINQHPAKWKMTQLWRCTIAHIWKPYITNYHEILSTFSEWIASEKKSNIWLPSSLYIYRIDYNIFCLWVCMGTDNYDAGTWLDFNTILCGGDRAVVWPPTEVKLWNWLFSNFKNLISTIVSNISLGDMVPHQNGWFF